MALNANLPTPVHIMESCDVRTTVCDFTFIKRGDEWLEREYLFDSPVVTAAVSSNGLTEQMTANGRSVRHQTPENKIKTSLKNDHVVSHLVLKVGLRGGEDNFILSKSVKA